MDSYFKSGTFKVGCNYWASHAGMFMWSDWRPEVVEADFAQLRGNGLELLRVFPLWPDFQPLKTHWGGGGQRKELRHGEEPLPDTPAGRAGMSEEMLGRFGFLADAARRHGLKLVVGLLTGWMSGRLFVPPALEGVNILSDPLALMWELRFVRCFVGRFKGHPAIVGWDLGNECNCMGGVGTRQEAWLWTAAVADAIRAEDKSLPVVSGMHGLGLGDGRAWNILDQGENCDLLTTHPYPLFTPGCDLDPLDSLRPCLHGAAESRLCGDVGGRPCMVEETGTLSPQLGDETTKAAHVRTALFAAWAHDCLAYLWWCAYDQDHLERTPYDWNSVERELGLFKKDRAPKPVAAELKGFGAFLERAGRLPGRLVEAVCVLTEGQDHWAAAYGAFVLAKQAGFDLEFQWHERPLKDSGLYLLPSLQGGGPVSRRLWLELLGRAEAGAEVYVSVGTGLLSPFESAFGVESRRRQARRAPLEFTAPEVVGGDKFVCAAPYRMELAARGARVVGAEADGNPVFTEFALGKGKVWLLAAPLETWLSGEPGVYQGAPYWKLYAHLAKAATAGRAVAKRHPALGVTEHPVGPDERLAVLVNHSPEALPAAASLKDGWEVKEALRGGGFDVPANDAVVLRLVRTTR